VRMIGQRLGIGIANVVNIFDPEEVVVGGGVSTAGDLLLGPAADVARQYMLPGVGGRTEIRLARYGVEAGVRGAALLAVSESVAAS
jgi:glucokinase